MARLSPLKGRHINFTGHCRFHFAGSGPGEGLRPLRDPEAAEPARGGYQCRAVMWARVCSALSGAKAPSIPSAAPSAASTERGMRIFS